MYCELRNTRKFCHCEAIGRGNPLTMQSEMRLLRGVYPALVAGLAMTKTRFIIQSHVVLTYSAVSHQERKHQRALNHSKTQHRAGNAVAVKELGPKKNFHGNKTGSAFRLPRILPHQSMFPIDHQGQQALVLQAVPNTEKETANA